MIILRQKTYSLTSCKAISAGGALSGAIAGGSISNAINKKKLKEEYNLEEDIRGWEDKSKEVEERINNNKKLLKDNPSLKKDYDKFRERFKEELGDGSEDPELEDLVSDEIIDMYKLDPRVKNINLDRDEYEKNEYQRKAEKIKNNPDYGFNEYARYHKKSPHKGIIIGGAVVGGGLGLAGSIAAEKLLKRVKK